MAGRSEAPAWGVRELASVAVSVFGGLAVVLSVTLIVSSTRIHRAVEVIARDAQSQAIVNELELSLQTYQRLGNLWVVTGEEEVAAARRAQGAQIDLLLAETAELAASDEERTLLRAAEQAIETYRRERERVEAASTDVDEVLRATTAPLQAAQSVLRSLSELNDREMQQARDEADRADRTSRVVGFSVAAALLLGLLTLLIGVRRLVVPIVELHAGLRRIRSGESDVQVAISGPREIAEAGEGFNEMAAMLARQRDAQLTSLAAVAHDLRNPLAALSMGLQTLERARSETHKRRVRERLDRQVERLLRMVGDLLEASRIEAGTLQLRVEELDVRDIVDDTLRLYAPTVSDHRLSAELPPEPVIVKGDADRIGQALSNLVSNAVKFTPRGGAIDVRLEEDGADAVLSVSDTGVGIAEEEQSQIFLPFRRMQPELAPGVGLGLSVVRHIARAHGGDVEVDSELGEGSTFRVRIPLAAPHGERTSAVAAGAS